MLADVARDGVDLRQVDRAVLTLRRTDGAEDDITLRHRTAEVGGELEAPLPHVPQHHLREPRLVERDLARLQLLDLLLDEIDADDRVAEVGQTGPSYKSDVARSDDRDLVHSLSLLPVISIGPSGSFWLASRTATSDRPAASSAAAAAP